MAQESADRFYGLMDQEKHHHHQMAKENKNEIQMLFSGLFIFYKTIFSSQDERSCTFKPSCSEYALLSIKKKGVVVGSMAAFDRLTRCNGLLPQNYEHDRKTGLLIDDVE
jgi:uncharacterized protein